MVRRAQVQTGELPNQYTYLFNPASDRGVAVLPPEAFRFWSHIDGPFVLPKDSDDVTRQLLNELLDAALLVPVELDSLWQPDSPQVISVWLHITNQCNLRCDYCYIDKSPEKMSRSLGHAAVDAVMRSAQAGGFRAVKLKFAGGEATLRADTVLALDAYAREQAEQANLEYDAVILSNGLHIRDALAQECLRRGLRFMISLDGLGTDHNSQRRLVDGRPSANQVRATIERLLSLGLEPFISVTVTDRNAHSLPETVAFLLSRGLPFNLNFVRENRHMAGFPSIEEREQVIIDGVLAAFDVIERDLPPHELLGMLVDRANFSQAHSRTCGVGESYLVIDQHGGVSKCHLDMTDPVTDVHAVDPLAAVRADRLGVQNPPVEQKEGCRSCEWRSWCTGGCPKLTHHLTGRYDIKSPYCGIYKAVFPRLLRLEALRLLKYAAAG